MAIRREVDGGLCEGVDVNVEMERGLVKSSQVLTSHANQKGGRTIHSKPEQYALCNE